MTIEIGEITHPKPEDIRVGEFPYFLIEFRSVDEEDVEAAITTNGIFNADDNRVLEAQLHYLLVQLVNGAL